MDFDIEDSDSCNKDSLQLYEGKLAIDSRLRFSYCGSQLPYENSFNSIKNELLVIFTTDGEIEAKGFKLNYSMV